MQNIKRKIQKTVTLLTWMLAVFLTEPLMSAAYAPEEAMTGIADDGTAQVYNSAPSPAMALVYLCDALPLFAEPTYDSRELLFLPSGKQVWIEGCVTGDPGTLWCLVSVLSEDEVCWGYVPRDYLACVDEVYLAWEAEMFADMLAEKPADGTAGSVFFAETDGNALPADIAAFPESYQDALLALKQAHPNWVFVCMNTGLDWETVLQNELIPERSLIPTDFPLYMQGEPYSAKWANATKETLAYYMDSRNWLTEYGIFQFELLTYNASYHTEDALSLFLANTFMRGKLPDSSQSYASAIWTIGKDLKVSPFHLACRIRQEQGDGTSPLISGTYPGYEGYYNYFNIGASGNTDTAEYVSGLTTAKNNGWDSAYASIAGGARVISSEYILQGQDTLYLQKFDVDASAKGLFWHQYMQNICAPSSECLNVRSTYLQAGSLNNAFLFKIPVYANMPDTACAKPVASLDITLTPPAGYVTDTVYLDGIACPATYQNDVCTVTAPDGNVKTAIMYGVNEKGTPTGMYVWELSYNGRYQASPLPEFQDALSYHGFSVRITGDAGMRFKSGISRTLRESLLSSGGVCGYRLSEYGTLVMKTAYYGTYPLIKDGEKTSGGRAFAMDGGVITLDKIFETVDDRYRFTSVLVGIPASSYQTEYTFRSYMLLEKDGKEILLYGPPMSRSIYALANQALESGFYPEGSASDVFLRSLIQEADAWAADAS